MKSLHIRSAQRNDLPALHALLAECLPHDTFGQELLAEKLFQFAPHPQYESRVLIVEAGGRIVACMQGVRERPGRLGWLGPFAVAASHRRQGTARQLWRTLREDLLASCSTLAVLGVPGNYFAPGIDLRYQPALRFVESLGFVERRRSCNMIVELAAWRETFPEPPAIEREDVRVARGEVASSGGLLAMISSAFSAGWAAEVKAGLQLDPPCVHVAWQGNDPVAFAAHSTQNREWGFFGPMGTLPALRGSGVGRLLLWHCLRDLHEAGHSQCLIPWVGPVEFYRRSAGARVVREFAHHELDRCEADHLPQA